jgi:hypothetical protein
MGHKPGIGAIFGIVSEEGVAKPNSPVLLLDRENKKIVQRQLTREDGGFTFNGLNEEEATYMAVATDEDGDTPKNALIQDRILPVPAYSGATFWGNWQHLVRRDGALTACTGDYAQFTGDEVAPIDSLANQRFTTLPGARLLGAGAITLAPVDPIPGAPHIPIFQYTNRASYSACPPNLYAGNGTTQQSLEIVVDLLSVSGSLSVGAATAERENFSQYRWSWAEEKFGSGHITGPLWRSQLRYTAGTRTLTVRYRHGVATHHAFDWDAGLNAGTLVDRNYVFPVDAVPEGLVHIAYTFHPGVRLALFVNGIVVGDWDLSSESPSLPTYFASGGTTFHSTWNGGFVIGGVANSVPAGLTARVGPYAFYRKALSDSEVVAHYNALFDTSTLPNVTGYVKEVVIDSPSIYARLDDTTDDAVARGGYQIEHNRRAHTLNSWRLQQLNPAGISLEQPSSVVGGMATLFAGGYLHSASIFRAVTSPTSYTIEFFVRPSATPVAGERILYLRNDTVDHVWVSVNADRTLTVGHRLTNATNESFIFDTPLPSDTDTYVAVVLDKSTLAISLYINGLLEQTRETVSTVLAAGHTVVNTNTTPDSIAHAFIAGTDVGATTFKGKLYEVAFYNKALTAARLLAHYNARNTP